jgi:hypothetical protein
MSPSLVRTIFRLTFPRSPSPLQRQSLSICFHVAFRRKFVVGHVLQYFVVRLFGDFFFFFFVRTAGVAARPPRIELVKQLPVFLLFLFALLRIGTVIFSRIVVIDVVLQLLLVDLVVLQQQHQVRCRAETFTLFTLSSDFFDFFFLWVSCTISSSNFLLSASSFIFSCAILLDCRTPIVVSSAKPNGLSGSIPRLDNNLSKTFANYKLTDTVRSPTHCSCSASSSSGWLPLLLSRHRYLPLPLLRSSPGRPSCTFSFRFCLQFVRFCCRRRC